MKIATKLQNAPNSDETIEKMELMFSRGIIGFHNSKKYDILADEEYFPFLKLVSKDEKGVSFVLLDPWLVKDDYQVKISDSDVEELGAKKDTDVMIYTIVTLEYAEGQIALNLMAPLVINRVTKKGIQLILEEPQPLQYIVNL